jgi:hypothetical protein
MLPPIAARDDWAFLAEGYTVACIRKDPFASVDDVTGLVRAVLDVMATIPASAGRVDRSVDYLVARIRKVRQGSARVQCATNGWRQAHRVQLGSGTCRSLRRRRQGSEGRALRLAHGSGGGHLGGQQVARHGAVHAEVPGEVGGVAPAGVGQQP